MVVEARASSTAIEAISYFACVSGGGTVGVSDACAAAVALAGRPRTEPIGLAVASIGTEMIVLPVWGFPTPSSRYCEGSSADVRRDRGRDARAVGQRGLCLLDPGTRQPWTATGNRAPHRACLDQPSYRGYSRLNGSRSSSCE